MNKLIKRLAIGILAAVAAYVVLGVAVSDYLIPPEKVQLESYLRSGDKFISRTEGFVQTILANKDGWTHLSLEAQPFAEGPPIHLHENFEETFTVRSGTLSIIVAGEKRTLSAGESFTVPRMTFHKPFNETGETVVVESAEDTRTMPTQFAYILSQIYPIVDKAEGRPGIVAMTMQMSVWGNDMDSYLAEGPPVAIQKAMRILLRPAARLLGYKYHNDEYKPLRPN
ncbi:MAG: cupin domain-containing protein [Pyrinomonadaceae bacterium]|nr:cupin domain-containing protein [Pyrinomonadaceae bacterium]